MSDPRLLLFDIDGTLIAGGTPAHRAAIELACREVFGVDGAYEGVEIPGQTDRFIISRMLRRAGVDEAALTAGLPRAFALIEEYVEQHPEGIHGRALGGVHDLFELLRRRHHLGVVTGNLPGVARVKLARIGLLDAVLVDGRMVGGFGDISEDRADVVLAAIDSGRRQYRRAFSAATTVVIGDTPNDIRAAHAAGALCVGVATGPHSAHQLGGADMVVDSLIDAAMCAEAMLALVAR